MTSGAKKEKARKKARAEKLLEKEKARQAPSYDDSIRAAGSWRGPAHYPEHIRAYLYDTPTGTSFYDTPELAAIHTAPATTSVLALRDFSALRTESPHPWRTFRRRNHRLLPQRHPFPRSLPKKNPLSRPTPLPTPSAPKHALTADPGPYDAIPVLALPRPIPLPGDPYDPLSMQREPPPRALPAATAYGTVQSALALVCAQEYPWAYLAVARISEITGGNPY
ncbi:hypothetical protein B0H13DRAFT_1867067 [Mycena leptocephala]|nr:hypothetical protein B0H13DRAFT_1867067 [Mycena leptocephala]